MKLDHRGGAHRQTALQQRLREVEQLRLEREALAARKARLSPTPPERADAGRSAEDTPASRAIPRPEPRPVMDVPNRLVEPYLTADMVIAVVARALAHKRRIVILGAGLALLSVGLFILAASTPTPPATATVASLPVMRASELVDCLKRAGLEILATIPLTVPDGDWRADEGIQITVRDSGSSQDAGEFLVFSYRTAPEAETDVIRVTRLRLLESWQVVKLSNLIVAFPPQIDPALRKTLSRHLAQAILVPVRPFLSTSNP